jgi:hypothetical protein
MSQINENQIHDRLKRLSELEPGKEASDRVIQKARDALIAEEGSRVGLGSATGTPPSLILRLTKIAAAAVLMIGAGFIGGRLSAPEPMDVQELRVALAGSLKSSLEPAIRQEILAEIESRLQLALTAERDVLKQELARQVRRDLETFAEQTYTAVGNLTEQRLMRFAWELEAARIRERQHVAAAFDYMGSRFGDGLITLAAQRNNLSGIERKGLSPDIFDN